jgi:hypothetical protein
VLERVRVLVARKRGPKKTVMPERLATPLQPQPQQINLADFAVAS